MDNLIQIDIFRSHTFITNFRMHISHSYIKMILYVFSRKYYQGHYEAGITIACDNGSVTA